MQKFSKKILNCRENSGIFLEKQFDKKIFFRTSPCGGGVRTARGGGVKHLYFGTLYRVNLIIGIRAEGRVYSKQTDNDEHIYFQNRFERKNKSEFKV